MIKNKIVYSVLYKSAEHEIGKDVGGGDEGGGEGYLNQIKLL